MKRSFFCLAVLGLLIIQFNAHAQNVAIGIRGGLSIPNLSAGGSEENPLNTGYSSRQGPDLGIYAEFKISDLFSIQPMVQYSSQGGKKDGMQAFPTPDAIKAEFQEEQQPAPTYLYANFKSTAKLNYLMIPVLAKFGWNFSKSSPWCIYADAGPFLGFLLSAKQVTAGNSNFYLDQAGKQQVTPSPQNLDTTQNIKSQLNTTNFGVEGNIGLQYKLKQSYVFIEGGGNYGFLNIQKGTANGKNNTGAATVDIGYAVWFGKK